MSRIFSLGALGSSWILVATSFSLLGDDKTAIDSGAEAKARQAIKSALQAEASGNNQRRKELLARAVSDAPQVGETNWHSGRIQTGGKWLELSSAEQQAASDSRIAEYRKLREEAADNPKLLRNLARWCIKMGWEDTARLHYAQLLKTRGADLESKQEAIKRLDLYNVDGNWVTGKELAVQRQKTKAIEDALAKWRPRVKRLQTAIDGDDFPRREHATKELEQLDDPQVIPVLESFLVDGEDRFQEAAVKRLAQFPHYEATQALAHYAVLSPFLSAREKATAALRDRSVSTARCC